MGTPLTVLPPAEESRPWYKRMTLVCGGLLILAQYLETQGILPQGIGAQLETMGEQAMALVETLLGLGTLVGAYRQIAK